MTKTFILPSFLYKPLYLGSDHDNLEEHEIAALGMFRVNHRLGACINASFLDDLVHENHNMRDIFLPCKCMLFEFYAIKVEPPATEHSVECCDIKIGGGFIPSESVSMAIDTI